MDELYGPGAAETLQVGHSISLTLSDDMECTATFIKAFTPFTQSQVLLVNVHDCPGVVNPVIIKIYDPRFMGYRKQFSFPWSLELEIAVAERRDAIIRGDREDDYNAYQADINPVFFEEHLYRTANEAFRTERQAYERLHVFQGVSLPRCYASGIVHVLSPSENIPRPIKPHFLLLEYVEGPSLASVDPKLVSRSLARSLLYTVRAFGLKGVIHNDLHKGNIIFRSDASSTLHTPFSGVVIIDFGEVILRYDDESDDDWKGVLCSLIMTLDGPVGTCTMQAYWMWTTLTTTPCQNPLD
jgi:serine/threonine protein kinase